jgi:uncharacterized protein (TIGR03083 family)
MTDLSTDLAGQVAAAFDALADALAPLDDAAWDTPSLCAGWRVREVVAHVTMPARYDQPAYLAELELAAGDFTTLSETIARRDACAAVRDPARAAPRPRPPAVDATRWR